MDYYTTLCHQLPLTKPQFDWLVQMADAFSHELIFIDWRSLTRKEKIEAVELYLKNAGVSDPVMFDAYRDEIIAAADSDVVECSSLNGATFFEEKGDLFYVESQKSVDFEVLMGLLYLTCRKFDLPPMVIYYANTGSRNTPESNGGGALVVSKEGWRVFYGGSIADDYRRALLSGDTVVSFLQQAALRVNATPRDLWRLAWKASVPKVVNTFTTFGRKFKRN